MPDPNSGLYKTDPEDPSVCVSLDGQTRHSDFCVCGVVDDLRRFRGEWLCRSCLDYARSEEDHGPTMEELGERDAEDTWEREGYY